MTKKEWKRRRLERKRQKRHDRIMQRFADVWRPLLAAPDRSWFVLSKA